MINKLKNIMLSVFMVTAFAVPALAVSAPVSAQSCTGIEECLDTGAKETDPTNRGVNPEERVFSIIETVINVFSIIVGVVSVIMIIIGGLKYITSGGDSGNVSGAKNTILYAIIGLVVVALAQIIVRFVLDTATA